MSKNKGSFVPVLVETKEKKEVWNIDVSNLSITELVKLRDELINEQYKKTIPTLDSIIRENIESTAPFNKIYGNSYVRTYKKNKKEEKNKKRTRNRRKKYDKYKK